MRKPRQISYEIDGKWPKCGARTRAGKLCCQPAVRTPGWKDSPRNGRCRFHGGLSTGPRTEEGKRRVGDAAKARYRATIVADAEATGYQMRRRFEDQGDPLAAEIGFSVTNRLIAEYDLYEAQLAALMALGKTRSRARFELRQRHKK